MSHIKPDNFPDNFRYEYTDKCQSVDVWSRKAVYELRLYVHTTHCVLIHTDGYVVTPSAFDPEWLKYDYIGALFPPPTDDFSYRDANGVIRNVGNSVSLRSKKLLSVANDLNLPWQPFHGYWNEDGYCSINFRHRYEEAGCVFAPPKVAKYFSREYVQEEGIEPFCFHKWHGMNAKYPSF